MGPRWSTQIFVSVSTSHLKIFDKIISENDDKLTNFFQGVRLISNLTKCDSKIRSACDISLNQNLSAGIENCSNIMTEFRWNIRRQKNHWNELYFFLCCRVKVNITKEKFPTNCSIWSNLKTFIPALRDCNKGESTSGLMLRDKEREVKDKLSVCKKAFSGCKKYEDQSIAYIATCKKMAFNRTTGRSVNL